MRRWGDCPDCAPESVHSADGPIADIQDFRLSAKVNGTLKRSTEHGLKQGITGVCITVLPLVLLAALHLLFLPEILVKTYGFGPEEARRAV